MAEAMLIGAGVGAGTSMLTGNDPLKGAALGGAMGGASAGFGGAGVSSGAEAAASNMPSHLTSTAGAGVLTQCNLTHNNQYNQHQWDKVYQDPMLIYHNLVEVYYHLIL